MAERETISLAEAARRANVSPATLKRWAQQKVVPVKRGRWTPAAAAHARVVARMRERGHSLREIRRAVKEGRLAFGFTEELLPPLDRSLSVEDVARRTGLEPELVGRINGLLGTPAGLQEGLTEADAEMFEHVASALAQGLPLVALLELVRVYAQAIRKVAEAEVRLFHLYVHTPLIDQGVPPFEIAEEMQSLAGDMLPLATPLTDYLHRRYLRYFSEQDVIGHMEADVGLAAAPGRVTMAFCFVDLTGFTRFTEEEGDEQALDLVEHFVETVQATLPSEATVVKTIGDEVMVVSPDAASLTEWAVGLLAIFQQRPQPRVGIHHGSAVYRDGDYFGGDVNLAHRLLARALAGEVMVTAPVVDAIAASEYLTHESIGEVELKGVPEPQALFVVSGAG